MTAARIPVKDRPIGIRLTTDIARRARRRAHAEGLRLSEWVRRLIVRALTEGDDG